jgi:hypothetical protein
MTWGASLAREFPPGRWRARWIWAPDADAVPDGSRRSVVAIRRRFDLAAVPASAPARLTALSKYVLRVNGVEVARGPVRANPRRQHFDVLDLAGALRIGANELEILAWRYADPTPWWLPPPLFSTDLVNGAVVFEAKVADAIWTSDSSWQAAALPSWSLTMGQGVGGRGLERIDPAALATAAWVPAIERRAHAVGESGHRPEPPSYPIGPNHPRPISWPTAAAVDLTDGGAGEWLSASGVVAGTVAVDAEGPAGETVTVQVSELLGADGRPQPTEHDARFEVVCTGGRSTAETLDFYGLAGLVVTAPAGVVVHGVRVIERQHDVTGDASFTCSDPVLEEIWRVGRRTVTLCSNDAYLDCPTREQRAWTGDSVVHQMVDLATNADWTLARWHPRLAASPRPDGMLPMAVAGDAEAVDFTVIPDWALHWVHSVHNLYRWVGDREEIGSLLQVVEGVVRWFTSYLDEHGTLIDIPGWVIVDWSSVAADGVSAAVNGLWARSLVEYAEMADWLGDADRAAWARATHDRLRAGFERLWDPERGRYADVIDGGVRQPAASQHGQAAAIVGGLVPSERLSRLVEVLTDETRLVYAAFSAPDGPALPNSEIGVGGDFLRTGQPAPWWDVDVEVVRAQPFFRYVVHDALVAAGRADLIAGACRDWSIALERCRTSWTETWYGGTVTHGWSSTPTRDLTTRVLGVLPAEPGYAVVAVDPSLGDLEWAAGRVPTPHGAVSVEVTRDRIVIDSPVPIRVDGTDHPAGRLELSR